MASEQTDEPVVAASMRLGMCPYCDAIHIILLDEEGSEIATGSLTPEDWARMVLVVGDEMKLRADASGIGPVMGRA